MNLFWVLGLELANTSGTSGGDKGFLLLAFTFSGLQLWLFGPLSVWSFLLYFCSHRLKLVPVVG